MTRVAVVAGANGFVGARVCAALAREGWEVVAAVRRADAGPVPGARRTHVVPDLHDDAAWRHALAGSTLFVHAAGRAHVMHHEADGGRAAFHRDNVDGTRCPVGAAAAVGVPRVVLVSSIAALGAGAPRPLDERATPAPEDEYGRSKLAGEEAAVAVAAGTGAHVAIVRPPMIYGPGMRGNPLRMFRLVDSGLPLPFGAVHNRRSVLYVDNLADAIAAIGDARRPLDGVYHVADAEVVSTSAFIRAAAAALGRPARLLPVPTGLLRGAARAAASAAAVVGHPLRVDVVDRLVRTLELDTRRLAADTGFAPRVSLAEGLRATAEWYRATARGVAA